MNLDELAVRILRTLLVTRRHRTAGADHRVSRLAENQSGTTGRDYHGVCRESLQLKRSQVHRDESATDLMIVKDERHHLPSFVLLNFAADLVPTHLLVKRVEKLLAG